MRKTNMSKDIQEVLSNGSEDRYTEENEENPEQKAVINMLEPSLMKKYKCGSAITFFDESEIEVLKDKKISNLEVE